MKTSETPPKAFLIGVKWVGYVAGCLLAGILIHNWGDAFEFMGAAILLFYANLATDDLKEGKYY